MVPIASFVPKKSARDISARLCVLCSFAGCPKKSARGRMGSSKSLMIMPDFRHAQPHIAQEALFSMRFEPSFGMPPASVVAKTSG